MQVRGHNRETCDHGVLPRLGQGGARVLIFWLALCLPLAGAVAQPLMMPGLIGSPGQLTVTAVGSYAEYDLRHDQITARSALVKATYSVLRTLDISVIGGVSDFVMKPSATEFTWWSEGYKPCAGGGLWFEPYASEPFSAHLGVSGSIYQNRGAFYKTSSVGGQEQITWAEKKQVLAIGYVTAGASYRVRALRLTAGAAGRRWWRGVRSRTEVRTGTERTISPGSTAWSRSGPQLAPYLCVELKLPGRFFLTAEAARWSGNDRWLTIGLGQTGPP